MSKEVERVETAVLEFSEATANGQTAAAFLAGYVERLALTDYEILVLVMTATESVNRRGVRWSQDAVDVVAADLAAGGALGEAINGLVVGPRRPNAGDSGRRP